MEIWEGSQGQPQGARGSQEEPRGARRSQGQPGAARRRQGQPGEAGGARGAWSSQEHPNSLVEPNAFRCQFLITTVHDFQTEFEGDNFMGIWGGSQGQPEGARGSQEEPREARRSQGQPGAARRSQGLRVKLGPTPPNAGGDRLRYRIYNIYRITSLGFRV